MGKTRQEISRGRREKARKYVLNYRMTHSCVRCGNSDHRVLDFHHRDPSKKSFNISYQGNISIAMIENEIAKCDLLCANCHRIAQYELNLTDTDQKGQD